MPLQTEPLWPQIHDYLAEVGAAKNVDQFASLVLTGIGRLIPFDTNGVFGVIDAAGIASIRCTVAEPGKWISRFNQYYWRLLPEIGLKSVQTGIINWRDYRSTEYVTDFLKPQGIWYSIGAICLGRSEHSTGWLVLHRSKSGPVFDEHDKFILDVIQPHLSNLYNLYVKLAASSQTSRDADDLKAEYQRLTKREAEVAALLCKGFNTELIGSLLVISPRTVHKHIENIFEKLRVTSRQELLVKLIGMKPGNQFQ